MKSRAHNIRWKISLGLIELEVESSISTNIFYYEAIITHIER